MTGHSKASFSEWVLLIMHLIISILPLHHVGGHRVPRIKRLIDFEELSEAMDNLTLPVDLIKNGEQQLQDTKKYDGIKEKDSINLKSNYNMATKYENNVPLNVIKNSSEQKSQVSRNFFETNQKDNHEIMTNYENNDEDNNPFDIKVDTDEDFSEHDGLINKYNNIFNNVNTSNENMDDSLTEADNVLQKYGGNYVRETNIFDKINLGTILKHEATNVLDDINSSNMKDLLDPNKEYNSESPRKGQDDLFDDLDKMLYDISDGPKINYNLDGKENLSSASLQKTLLKGDKDVSETDISNPLTNNTWNKKSPSDAIINDDVVYINITKDIGGVDRDGHTLHLHIPHRIIQAMADTEEDKVIHIDIPGTKYTMLTKTIEKDSDSSFEFNLPILSKSDGDSSSRTTTYYPDSTTTPKFYADSTTVPNDFTDSTRAPNYFVDSTTIPNNDIDSRKAANDNEDETRDPNFIIDRPIYSKESKHITMALKFFEDSTTTSKVYQDVQASLKYSDSASNSYTNSEYYESGTMATKYDEDSTGAIENDDGRRTTQEGGQLLTF